MSKRNFFITFFLSNIKTKIIFFLLSISISVTAQTENFVFPLKYNGAFAGAGLCPSVNFGHNYTRLGNTLEINELYISYDQYFKKIEGAIFFQTDKKLTENNIFSSILIEGGYTYQLKIHKKKILNFSVSTFFFQNVFNPSSYVFSSDIEVFENITAFSSENLERTVENNFGINSGILYKSERFYFGSRVQNMYILKKENNTLYPEIIFLAAQRLTISNKNQLIAELTFYGEKKSYAVIINNGIKLELKNIEAGIYKKNFFSKGYAGSTGFYLGYKNKKINIGYGFEFLREKKAGIYGLQSNILINIKLFCEKYEKNTIICPAYQL